MSSTVATASAMAPVGVGSKGKNSTAEIVAASMVGTAIEFYDNYCYSIAAASYFGLIFFTDVAKSDPVLATLLSFVTFAVSFGASVWFIDIRSFWRQARPQENTGGCPDAYGYRNLCGGFASRV